MLFLIDTVKEDELKQSGLGDTALAITLRGERNTKRTPMIKTSALAEKQSYLGCTQAGAQQIREELC